MKTLSKLLLAFSALTCLCMRANAQQIINSGEYFIDIDPGVGQATPLTFTSGLDSVMFTNNINVGMLTAGRHLLGIRTKTLSGTWGLYETKIFDVSNSITAAEYFFDDDPGLGNGIPINITQNFDSAEWTGILPTNQLSGGFHTLFVRTKDATGHWGLHDGKSFFINPKIVAAEYFFDHDPGLGNGTPLAITGATDSISVNTTILTAGVPGGYHQLFIRTKNDAGEWGLHDEKTFYIHPRIIAAEYFIDNDPGLGNGTPIAIAPGTDSLSFTTNIFPDTVPKGYHHLFVRTVNDAGQWSFYEPDTFYMECTFQNANAGKDTSLCGFSYTLNGNIPHNGAQGTWTIIGGAAELSNDTIHDATLIVLQPDTITLVWKISELPCTDNDTIIVIFKDGTTLADSILSSDADLKICEGETVQLSINTLSLGQNAVITWYESGCGNNVVDTGTFIDVMPTQATTYAVNVADACGTSACRQITIDVSNAAPTGTVKNVQAPASACVGNIVTVTCDPVPNAASYRWSVIGANTFQFTTNSPTLTCTLANPISSGWQICVFAENNCGITPNTKCTFIRGALSTPSIILGDDAVCMGNSYEYKINAVPGTAYYTWTLPNGIVFNNPPSNFDTSISVNITNSFNGGIIQVNAALTCGAVSASRTKWVGFTPALPSPIFGPTQLCAGETGVYSTQPQFNYQYNWTLPPGLTIINGQGTATITVTANTSLNSSNICVQAINTCNATGPNRCKTIYRKLPGTPQAITGSTAGVCGQAMNYACSSVLNANSYQWTVTNGSILSGNGTSAVLVQWSNSAPSGSLSVSAINDCGAGNPRSVPIRLIPNSLGTLVGSNNICKDDIQPYTINAIDGASYYNWGIPNGAVLIGSGNSVNIDFSGTLPGNYTITCTPGNICGNANTKTLAVQVNNCSRLIGNNPEGFKCYPNPVENQLTIKSIDKLLSITIMNNCGQEILHLKGFEIENNVSISTSHWSHGVYYLKAVLPDRTIYQSIVK
ncbi:MAG: hypothetical protein RIQ89_1056 [Bacteroidota bacterium]